MDELILNKENLKLIKKSIIPSYQREKLKSGIVHVGMGNFHRAHQVWFLDRLFTMGESLDWAIIGAGVKTNDAIQRQKFLAQDCLSTLIELESGNHHARVLDSIIDYIEVHEDNLPLIEAMSKPEIRIISLTITEGGYYINLSLCMFDSEHPDIQHDKKNPSKPCTVFGAIIAALKIRYQNGTKPFTVMSCDNLSNNGKVACNAVVGLATLNDSKFAQWITANVAFPNSMVDCITPATGMRELALFHHYGVAIVRQYWIRVIPFILMIKRQFD
ncbi:MAG: mannitol dehydrogenase family protein [Ostreibacterium sp.]